MKSIELNNLPVEEGERILNEVEHDPQTGFTLHGESVKLLLDGVPLSASVDGRLLVRGEPVISAETLRAFLAFLDAMTPQEEIAWRVKEEGVSPDQAAHATFERRNTAPHTKTN